MSFLKIAAKCLAGGLLLAVGTALLVLPGPGIPLIVAGVAILATEFEWAANLQARAGELWRRVRPARA